MERLLLNISLLYRGLNKYLDRVLKPYGLGSGQFLFIIIINENEGISMNEIITNSYFDKGTVSKTIQKLEEENYIYYKLDENDKRIKRIYTTNKTNTIMNELYQIRKEIYDQLSNNQDRNNVIDTLAVLANNSIDYLVDSEHNIRIGGINKVSLLDYPNKVCSTIFTSGCNFKCPFCYNKDLVFVPSDVKYYDINEIKDYLIKRNNMLDAIVISGGEPLLHSGLIDFIRDIKGLGLKVKLDTNGYYPNHLLEIINSNLVDYIAMDIKNSKDKYHITTGLSIESMDISNIDKSINIIINSNIEYEFRTTIINEFHTKDDIISICKWLKNAKRYYIQRYKETENVINPIYTTPSNEYMNELREVGLKYIDNIYIRGESLCIK